MYVDKNHSSKQYNQNWQKEAQNRRRCLSTTFFHPKKQTDSQSHPRQLESSAERAIAKNATFLTLMPPDEREIRRAFSQTVLQRVMGKAAIEDLSGDEAEPGNNNNTDNDNDRR